MNVGDWLEKRDPIYRSISQGRITKIENGKVYFFNSDAFDGFGATFEVSENDPFIKVSK